MAFSRTSGAALAHALRCDASHSLRSPSGREAERFLQESWADGAGTVRAEQHLHLASSGVLTSLPRAVEGSSEVEQPPIPSPFAPGSTPPRGARRERGELETREFSMTQCAPPRATEGSSAQVTDRRIRARWLAFLGWTQLFLLLACSGGARSTALPGDGEIDAGAEGGTEPADCIDEDGDGFGLGCAKGPDCDDDDPSVTDQCLYCAHEGIAGCPCDEPEALAECGKVISKLGDQVTCGYGYSTCSEGAWGPCIINNSGPKGDAGTARIIQAIGGSSPICVANPCDPYCQAFDNDTPDGITGDNIVATDAGITLGEGSDIPVSGTCTGGQYGSCPHSICEVGVALSPACDSDDTACGTPTSWDRVDADEVVNQAATDARHVVWTPSWPSVEAPDQIDPVGTSGRFTVYTPAFPSLPASEPVNATATNDRWPAPYTPTFPSVPATSVPDSAATNARYQHYDPVWPTSEPNETVGDPGTGANLYDPRFPAVDPVEVRTGDAFADIAPSYPPLPPTVTDRGRDYDLIPLSFPVVTPTDAELGVDNYANPPYPGVSPGEVYGGQSAYLPPSAGTTDPTRVCGGVGTPQVGGNCEKRPERTTQRAPWSRSITTTLQRSEKFNIPAGTLVDLRMTRNSGTANVDMYVAATGMITYSTNFPRDENNVGRTMAPTNAAQPTIFAIFPGGNVVGDVNTNYFDCAPRVGAGIDENCRFFFASAGLLQFGVRTVSGTATATVTMSETSFDLAPGSGRVPNITNYAPAFDTYGPYDFKKGSIAVIRALQRNSTYYGDTRLFARIGGPVARNAFHCSPSQDTYDGYTETCILYMDNGAPDPGFFNVGIDATYNGEGIIYDLDVGIFEPTGDCPANTVLDPANNTCCACAAGGTTGNGCPNGQCGTTSCPPGYVSNGTTCVWDGKSCTGAQCAQGSCEMDGSTPKCKIGCEGGSSHPCSNDASKCCSYTCPSGYNLVHDSMTNTWACQADTSSCTAVAVSACGSVAGGGWSCSESTSPVLCRKDCGDIRAGSHACAGKPFACCEHQCPSGYAYTGGTCAPITDSCTSLAQTLCAGMGATCAVEGGKAVCKKTFNCQDRDPNWHGCAPGQCCESTCANPDYRFDVGSGTCIPKTDSCTNTAVSLCANVGGSCAMVGGVAKCRVPVLCASHNCSDDSSKCCAWDCQDPDYEYLNLDGGTPKCENRDCALDDVCDEGDTCEDTGGYAHPNQQCRRFDGCPEGSLPCHENRCCTYECAAGTVLNPATRLCEQRSCGAPDVCNAGDVCVDSGDFAQPNQQCRHDTGACVGGTHACGASCCNYSCHPEPSPGYNYPNGALCERRDCGLCTEAGDQCAGATAEAGCRKDRGCSNGTHACSDDPTKCCDYSCPPTDSPDYEFASGSQCEKRDCGLCTDLGEQCLGSAPNIQCKRDNGCGGGGHSCNGDACCKPSCPPPGMPDYKVHVTDPIFGERCEDHGCSLCGSDACLGATADSGCKHDYGCGAGTFPCADDPTKCCNAVCPPIGYPDHTVVNGSTCERRDCSACPDGTSCTGASPNIQCCGSGMDGGSCIAKVCAVEPKCCSQAWLPECVARAKSLCDIDCIGIGSERACAVCYRDNIDHDGDGYSFADGDCMDCTAGDGLGTDFINPGAFDVPGNGIDDDCSGTVDDEIVACDQGLTLASNNPFDYARAMDLCRIQPEAGRWGVTAAKLVRSDATTTPGAQSHGILPNFGPALLPNQGNALAAFSTGTARRPGDTSFVKPKEAYDCTWDPWSGWWCTRGSKDWKYTSVYPQGYPVGVGCPRPSGSANDSSGLWMQIRVPTNAKSFTYNLDYYSSEFPEWVCSKYNDSFVALLTSNHPANVANAAAPHHKNISFDGNDQPINVNNNYFKVTSQAALAGSGFDGTNCLDRYNGRGQVPCGAATGWLTTSAPVQPGELITVHFAIWDTTDHIFDSTILLDNWQWSTVEQPIQTQPDKPGQPFVSEGNFIRDYDASTLCADKPGTAPRWARWSWTASAPNTSKIEFYVATASTAAGLATAEEKKLVFDGVSGWPVTMQNKHAIAKRQSTAPAYAADTQNGSTIVDDSLKAYGLPRTEAFLRIRSRLMASEDYSEAPTLKAWSLEVDCLPSQ